METMSSLVGELFFPKKRFNKDTVYSEYGFIVVLKLEEYPVFGSFKNRYICYSATKKEIFDIRVKMFDIYFEKVVK